jgi:AbrB family looped-hinge helix DNA binding protein
MRITRKGQITVPKRLRERFGITPEVDLEFLEERGRLVLVKAAPEAAVRAIRGSVKRLPFGKDVDDYLRATRGSR